MRHCSQCIALREELDTCQCGRCLVLRAMAEMGGRLPAGGPAGGGPAGGGPVGGGPAGGRPRRRTRSRSRTPDALGRHVAYEGEDIYEGIGMPEEAPPPAGMAPPGRPGFRAGVPPAGPREVYDEEFRFPEEGVGPPAGRLGGGAAPPPARPNAVYCQQQPQWEDQPYSTRAMHFAEAVDALRLIQELMSISPSGLREAVRILSLLRPPHRDLYLDVLRGALNRHEHRP